MGKRGFGKIVRKKVKKVSKSVKKGGKRVPRMDRNLSTQSTRTKKFKAKLEILAVILIFEFQVFVIITPV